MGDGIQSYQVTRTMVGYSKLIPAVAVLTRTGVTILRKAALGAFAVLSLTGMTVAGLRLWPTSTSSVSPERAALVEAFQSLPSCPGRLTGGFAAGSSSRKARPAQLRRVQERLRLRSGSAQELADSAVLSLALGRVEEATRNLAKAAERSPGNAAIASDLSAAYLSRYRQGGHPLDLVRALAAADRALAIDPNLLEARFNLAVALQRLFLTPAAIAAWTKYLASETAEKWTQEGERHLALLLKPTPAELWIRERTRLDLALHGKGIKELSRIVADYPQATRLYGEEFLLYSWATSFLDGRADEAGWALELARLIGAELVNQNRDRMLMASVATIDRSLKDSSSFTNRLAMGHRHFGLGLAAFQGRDATVAVSHFKSARELLRTSGSPFEAWAGFYLGASYYILPDYDRALRVWEPLASENERNDFGSLAGRIYWAIGLFHSVQSNPVPAQVNYHTALRYFSRLEENENCAFLHYLLSENLQDLGRHREAWIERYQALSARPSIINPTRLHNILFDLAEASRRAGEPEAALYFEEDLVELARSRNDELSIGEALLRRCRTLNALGRREASLADLEEARLHAESLPPGGPAQRLLADVMLAKGEILLQQRPKKAALALSSALDVYLEEKYYPLRVPIYRLRARAYLGLRDSEAAERDYQTAIEEIERERKSLVARDQRESYLNQARTTFDEMIRFQYLERGDIPKALDFSERARARALADLFPGADTTGSPFSAPEIQEELADSRVVVEFVVLDDRLLAWVIRSDGVFSEEIPVPSSDLDRRITGLRDAAERGTDLRESLSWLSDTLIAPIRRFIPPGSPLVIVPDKVTAGVPFSALYDSTSKRFLIEEHTVSISPSATMYVNLLRVRPPEHRQGGGKLLFVGDPAFSRSTFPELPRLPGAAKEALRLGSLYPDSKVLIDSDATEATFLAFAHTASVIHFAGHNYQGNASASPYLILAPDSQSTNSDGLLTLDEMRSLSLPNTRLLVLEGCGTAFGEIGAAEGVMSMARAFLAVGIPSVIATMWPISDTTGSSLTWVLHEKIKAGVAPAEALQAAKLRAIQARMPEVIWAPFELFGR